MGSVYPIPLLALQFGPGSQVPAASKDMATCCLSPRGTALCWACVTLEQPARLAGWSEPAPQVLVLPRCSFAFCWCLASVGEPCHPIFSDGLGSRWHTRERSQNPRVPVSLSPSVLQPDGSAWAARQSGAMGHSSAAHACILFDSP